MGLGIEVEPFECGGRRTLAHRYLTSSDRLQQKYTPQMVIILPGQERRVTPSLGQVIFEVSVSTQKNLLQVGTHPRGEGPPVVWGRAEEPAAGEMRVGGSADRWSLDVWQTYLASRPLMDDSFIPRKQISTNEKETLEQFDLKQLIVNVFRCVSKGEPAMESHILALPARRLDLEEANASRLPLATPSHRFKKALSTSPLVLVLLEYPFVFLPLYSYLALLVPHWALPFWVLACPFVNGLLASPSSVPTEIEVWPAVRSEARVRYRN